MGSKTDDGSVVPIGPFAFNTRLLILSQNERDIPLDRKACEVLKCLCEHESGLSLELLKECGWPREIRHCPANKTVENAISRIRAALGPEHRGLVRRRADGGFALRLMLKSQQNAAVPRPEPVTTRESQSAGGIDEVIARNARVELLKSYYSDNSLRAQNLFRFAYKVEGQLVETNIATSANWLELAIPLNELERDKFPVGPSAYPLDPISGEEIKRLQAELDARGIRFYNKPFYRLERFLPDDEDIIASFSMAQYADYKVAFGKLEEELIQALAESNGDPKEAFARRSTRLRLRENLLQNSNAIAAYGKRLCAGGANVLLAFRAPHDDGYLFSVKHRSKIVSTGREILSLLPSGMHQPTNGANAREESSVACTVYREILEEVFGYEELEGQDKHLAPRWFMSEPPVKWFTDNACRPQMEIVSFGINLVDGTYEFGVLVVIEDARYWTEFQGEMKPNKEFDDQETPMFSTLKQDALRSLLSESRCADTSLIAIVEGLKRLKTIDPDRVHLPKLQPDKRTLKS